MRDGLARWIQGRRGDGTTDLVSRQHANTQRFLKILLALGVPLYLAYIVAGQVELRATLWFLLLTQSSLLLALAAGRLEASRRRPDVYMFVASLLLIGMVSCTPLLSSQPHLAEVRVLYALPLAVASFAVWRPSFTLLLGAVAVPASVIGEWLATGALPPEPLGHVLLGAALTLVGAASNAFTRRLWSQWAASREHLTASDRVIQMGRMTAGIAHELKTPLAATDGALLMLGRLREELSESIGHRQVTEEDLQQIAAEMAEQLELAARANRRVASFVGAIREHTRGLTAQGCSRLRVRERVDVTRTLLAHRAKRAGVSFELEGDVDAALWGDPGKLDQLLTNLLGNAIDAISESGSGSRVVVRVEQCADGVKLEVEDDGPGVPESIRERIFDYLYTTRGKTSGTGLGLAICRDIARGEFGGSLDLGDCDHGARFVARLRNQAEREVGESHLPVFVPAT